MNSFFNTIVENFKWVIPTDKFYITDLIQIIIIFFILYYVMKNIKDTRAWVIVKGLSIVFVAYALVYVFSLSVIQYMIERILGVVTVALVIMFQPELRKMLEGIGKKDFSHIISKKIKKTNDETYFSKKTIDEIVIACNEMSKAKTGALIVFEKDIPLVDYINSGIEVNADISNQLIVNIFEHNTPLHDGAIIIQENKIKAATCYLPLSDNHNIKKSLGTRHRAGIGISEMTDAFVVIVSEETGNISWSEDGKIKHNVSSNELINKLSTIQVKKAKQNNAKKNSKPISNILSKLCICAISIILWAMILNVNDEVITIDFDNIPVTITNEDVISEVGQTFEIVEGDTIDVQIKGKRSIVENLTPADITAIANLKKLSYVYSVPIEVSLKSNVDGVIEIKTTSDNTMILQLEEIIEVEVPIEVNTTGEKLDDYYVSIDSTTPRVLKVVGPKSKVNVLDKAIVNVDVTNKTTDFVSSATPTLYDKNGEIVNSTNFTFNYDTIQVNAIVYETKEIPINVFLKDAYTDNHYYELIDYETDVETISIAGDDATLNVIEQLDIPIELSDNNDVISTTIINLENYLPDNTYLANNQNNQLTIQLELNKYTKSTISLTSENIKVNSLGSTYDIEFKAFPNTIELYVNENIIALKDVTVSMINPVIKVENNSVGNYSTELRLTNIDGVLYNSNLNVNYALSRKQ